MKKINSIKDLTPDSKNANKGTERGNQLIENSIRQYGLGRSILVDKNGNVIAGNKTLEGSYQIGLDKIKVVEVKGDELVVVQRTDLDLKKDKRARELSIADNRSGEINLAWDNDVLADYKVDFPDIDFKGVGFDFNPPKPKNVITVKMAHCPSCGENFEV